MFVQQVLNMTAKNIGEIVDQSHEFAIGLAEHFDILHRVSKGERNARISGSSQDELLKVLGKVTNEMIESVSREMNEREKAEKLLQVSEEKYRLLVENIPDITWIADQRGELIFISSNVEEVCGYTPKEICESGADLWFGKIHSDNIEHVKEAFQLLFTRGKVFDVEYRIQRKDGEWIWLRNRASINLGKDDISYADGIARDITERKQMEEKLRALSLTDELTGLYNRRGFFTLAEQVLKLSNRQKKGIFMLYADVDNLKEINDTFGHKDGDLALIEIADILKKSYRESDIVARIGGDEFVVIPIGTGGDNIEIITSRLQKAIEIHNSKGNRKYKLFLSFDVTYYDPEYPCSIDELLAQGDKLMYEKKKSKG